jgi:hypothetical protein
MSLNRGTAAAIVEAVQKDKACKEQIESWLGSVFGGIGWAGGVRNLGFIAGNAAALLGASYGAGMMAYGGRPVEGGKFYNSVEKEVGTITNLNVTDKQALEVCTGIAEATAKAINDALKRAPAGATLGAVLRADSQDRVGTTTAHTATGIWMRDKSNYVFDWHATLRVGDPMLHKTTADFSAGNGVLFSQFTGFD